MEIDDKSLSRLSYHELRVVAAQLGMLVQDNPDLDLLKQRIRHCKEV